MKGSLPSGIWSTYDMSNQSNFPLYEYIKRWALEILSFPAHQHHQSNIIFLKIPPLPPFKKLICIIVFYKCLLVRFAAVFLLFFKCMQIVDYVYYVYHPCQHVMTVSDNYIRGRCIMRPLLVYSNYCCLVSSTAEFFSI